MLWKIYRAVAQIESSSRTMSELVRRDDRPKILKELNRMTVAFQSLDLSMERVKPALEWLETIAKR